MKDCSPIVWTSRRSGPARSRRRRPGPAARSATARQTGDSAAGWPTRSAAASVVAVGEADAVHVPDRALAVDQVAARRTRCGTPRRAERPGSGRPPRRWSAAMPCSNSRRMVAGDVRDELPLLLRGQALQRGGEVQRQRGEDVGPQRGQLGPVSRSTPTVCPPIRSRIAICSPSTTGAAPAAIRNTLPAVSMSRPPGSPTRALAVQHAGLRVELEDGGGGQPGGRPQVRLGQVEYVLHRGGVLGHERDRARPAAPPAGPRRPPGSRSRAEHRAGRPHSTAHAHGPTKSAPE